MEQPPIVANNSLSPKIKQHNSAIKVKFKGTFLKQELCRF